MNLPNTASNISFAPDAKVGRSQSQQVRARLVAAGLHTGATWRISPTPFLLSDAELAVVQTLGQQLVSFMRSLNRLYYESVHGSQPTWVAEYLDQGKPSDLISFARMNRFRDDLPGVIRPDILLTDNGFIITELDAVPGGIGITGCLGQAYSELGWQVIGGANGMIDSFATMIRHAGASGSAPSLAIVVSDEARDYRPEMRWLAARLNDIGLPATTVEPHEIIFTEEALHLPGDAIVSVLYRFFELFDLKNVPKADLMLYAVKKGRVAMTAPPKPWLEEKMAFALLHHPVLASFWTHELGAGTFSVLRDLIPRTWILDPRPVPPHAVIPDLGPGGQPLADYHLLGRLGQKERRLVVKPSGFSELAWGSRGVSVGHDMSQQDWAGAVGRALASFPTVPYILQEFRKGRRVESQYHDPVTDGLVEMPGRVRLSPYYFVHGEKTDLGGILATICPLDKKLIHGMTDAIMAPCAISSNNGH
jgi:hypothetical protein